MTKEDYTALKVLWDMSIQHVVFMQGYGVMLGCKGRIFPENNRSFEVVPFRYIILELFLCSPIFKAVNFQIRYVSREPGAYYSVVRQ